MTLTGPDRDEVFQWDPSEPELMKAMVMAGVCVQIPVTEGQHRTCTDCGKPYLLPLDYAAANPLIRDRCPECVSVMQREREER
jgi:hypothetical protein